MMMKIFQISKLYPIVLFAFLVFTGCSSDDDNDDPSFSFIATWSVSYDFTVGISNSGTFTANLKSNDMWDYTENSDSITDIGRWSSDGDNVTFFFLSSGDAIYIGSKTSDTTLSGTMVADSGGSRGTWTATR